jgi:RNA polymerase sigma-70 factor (ECF subfamily)
MNYPANKWSRSTPADPDVDLLREAHKAPEGDLRAFEQLVVRYQRRVVANCRYITRDQNNAEDLAQEVMVKVFFGLRGFEGRSSFANWLQRIKLNHCLDYLRKQAHRSFVGIEEQDVHEFDQLKDLTTADDMAEVISNRQLISEVLDSIPNTLRIPLILCDMDQMSYEEVSESLGVSLSATKMRIKRARELFRERYQKVQCAATAIEQHEQ